MRRVVGTQSELCVAVGLAALLLAGAIAASAQTGPSHSHPTFYKDVLPILQQHCQTCHRTGEIAPMPLTTYAQTQPWAKRMAALVSKKAMPPWFADPRYGHFANDPSLTPQQIQTLVSWAQARAPAGRPHDAPPPRHWTRGWNISPPNQVITMPRPVAIPAEGEIEYTYEIVPTGFTEDKWVRMCEVRPSSPQYVHHAVVYIRPPDSHWLRDAPIGVPFTASKLKTEEDRREAHWTDSDMLLVYAPGSSPDRWPEDMAKFVPAGSDLVIQMHYTTNGHAGHDRTRIGLVFSKTQPAQRVITLQLTNHSFIIPPNTDNFRVEVFGTLPNDATLLSFMPHMHLRGKRFEYDLVNPDGSVETLLRVNYHFHWQLSYRLAEPLPLKAGTKLRAVAWYDNSKNNPHNPDPDQLVTWGDQTSKEMMVGFFDVAVPATMDKQKFFIRPGATVSSTHESR